MSVSEIEDLKTLLHTHNGDVEKLKKVMSKIMANVYVGKDMSPLFPDIVLQARVQESSVNRLIGMFTAQYGLLHPDTALLCINQLTKDILHDSDPLQRGHALQTLGSLNIPSLAEYIAPPIKVALQDSNQYVRRLAINGCVKICNMSKEVFEEQLLVCHLEEMTEDFDESVAVIAVAALAQVKPGYHMKQSWALKILKHLDDFSDWQVPIILHAIDAKNLVSTEEELIDIINYTGKYLDDCSSSVVLHVIKLLQQAVESQNSPVLMEQFHECTKKPMLFRIRHSNPEISYIVCREILGIFPDKGKLSGYFATFFPAYYDPAFLKAEKLHILASLITVKNVKAIVSELFEYLSSPKHDDVLKEVVECLSVCVMQHGTDVGNLVVRVADKLQTGSGLMISTLLPFLENIVISSEDCAPVILPQLQHCAEFDLTTEASVALLSLLGSFGNILPECVSMFYCYVEDYFNLDTSVKSALLSATMKQLGLTGMNVICKKLLTLMRQDEDPILNTKAKFYSAVVIAKQGKCLVSEEKHSIVFSPITQESITDYPVFVNAAASARSNEDKKEVPKQEPSIQKVAEESNVSNDLLDIGDTQLDIDESIENFHIGTTISQNHNKINDDLTSIFQTVPGPDAKSLPLTLQNFLVTLTKPSMTPDVYEQNWGKNWRSEKFKAVLSNSSISVSSDLQAMLSEDSIATMAITPPTVDPQQLFLYSSSAGLMILIKILLSFVNDTLELEVRAANHMVSQLMLKFIKHRLGFFT